MARAACADRLDLVDAAYERPGKQHSHVRHLMELCRHCPLAPACLDWAMKNPEWGVWGGVGPNERTRHGGRSAAAEFHYYALPETGRP